MTNNKKTESILDISGTDDKNVLPFEKPKLLKLMGNDGNPPSKNWLEREELGSVFFVRHRQYNSSEFALGLFRLVSREGLGSKVYVLQSPETPGKPLYVDPIRFSNQFEKYETVGILRNEDISTDELKKEEQERNTNDGEGNRG